MQPDEQTYRALQVHLDQQTVGFPAAKSGADIRILQHLFPGEQAEAAMLLTYRYESLEQIRERARQKGVSDENLERVLDTSASRGVIGARVKDGAKQYRNIPYVVGMAEAGMYRPTPEFLTAAYEYAVDGEFWNAFLGSAVPQMRTIPVEESITPQHHVGRYDEIEGIIEATDGPIAIIECICRKTADNRGTPCKRTERKETCMVLQDGAKHLLELGGGREITKAEAIRILRKNGEDGLVLQPGNAKGPDFICSCCGCCCGILQLHKSIEDPVSHWATNYYAVLDDELCSGCQLCEDSCQTDALKFDQETRLPAIELKRCLGCGNCIVVCPDEALTLERREDELVPPATNEEMTELIMTAKG